MIRLIVYIYRFKAFLRKLKSIIWGLKGITVDVGGGARPNPLADIIIEPFVDDNSHRQGLTFESYGKICIITSADRIPFREKVIEHLTCAHVLEHVENPKAVLKEFSRVAKRGYLEVPSYESELFFDREDHVWCVRWSNSNKEKFEFFPKPEFLPNKLSDIIREERSKFDILYFGTFANFNLHLYWEGLVDCLQTGTILAPKTVKQSHHYKDPTSISLIGQAVSVILNRLKALFKRQVTVQDLVRMMFCLKCKSTNLRFSNLDSKIVCNVCNQEIKVIGNYIYISP